MGRKAHGADQPAGLHIAEPGGRALRCDLEVPGYVAGRDRADCREPEDSELGGAFLGGGMPHAARSSSAKRWARSICRPIQDITGTAMLLPSAA